MSKPLLARNGQHSLTAIPDAPDFRDYIYKPALINLKRKLTPPSNLKIRNQGMKNACTGFGLAAAIDILIRKSGGRISVSARMLYEMALRYDEWPGWEDEGSSCRGAIKGWYNMGVCREKEYEYDNPNHQDLTIDAAKDARNNTIGMYYRLGERISDYHAALNEAGVIFCSAKVHQGWDNPDSDSGDIVLHQELNGAHAFAIVGYDIKGFWVQNSWGDTWARKGLGFWTYEDWHANVQDAWVFRMALPTPQIWHLPPRSGSSTTVSMKTSKPTRAEIAGHFIHIDDGHFHNDGRYWSNLADVKKTATRLAKSSKYKHLLFYAHGGLNSPSASAKRIAAMKETFKSNQIYPYHLMYDTGILEELKDILFGHRSKAEDRAGGLTDWLDTLLERSLRVPGRAFWREMKTGASSPFEPENAGSQSLAAFITEISQSQTPIKVHLVGHSTGMILLSYLLQRLAVIAPEITVKTVSFLAPAGTVDLFSSHVQPFLKADRGEFRIEELTMYNLPDSLEQDDEVTKAYNKSLLYLVSNSFEESVPARVLGMQNYSKIIERRNLPHTAIHYSKGKNGGARICASETHGGFDNDPLTMNHILRRVLGHKPVEPFTKENLDY